MPAWLHFPDYARLKRMEPGTIEAIQTTATSPEETKRHANNLRGLLAHWTPPHHWRVSVLGSKIIVRKGRAWLPLPPKHRESGHCPTCHAPGLFDMESPAGAVLPKGSNWIWYNRHVPGWECGECWLK